MSEANLATVVVDHRLRDRRVAVRRDAGRRRLKRLLVLLLVAAISLATVVVLRSPILDVDEVVVSGTQHTDAELIREVAAIDVGAPLLLADVGAAESRIEALPWVLDASVRRRLPDHVAIDVVEREPAAVISGGGMAMLVDHSGRVLAPLAEAAQPPYVHVVVGEVPPEPGASLAVELSVAIELAARLRTNPAGVVSAIHVSPSLQLRLTEGGLVDFGDDAGVDEKLEAFRTLYARVDRTCLARIDLRLSTHPVVTRRPQC